MQGEAERALGCPSIQIDLISMRIRSTRRSPGPNDRKRAFERVGPKRRLTLGTSHLHELTMREEGLGKRMDGLR
jgi:hypothetical protein